MVSESDVSRLVDFHLALRGEEIDTDKAFAAIGVLCQDGGYAAFSLCSQIIQSGPIVDPSNPPLNPLRSLNAMGILGSKIPLLWEISGRQVGRLIGVVRGCDFSICKMSGLLLHTSIRQRRLLVDLDQVITELKTRLPRFNPDAITS